MTSPTPDEVRQRLDEFSRRRGYLMAHQGVMAAALPALQDGYGVLYKALTLDQNHLTPLEKEFVWLALLTTQREHVGTHHIDLFYKAGGDEAMGDAAFRLAAWAEGVGVFGFMQEHWQRYFPGRDPARGYLDGAAALVAPFPDVTLTMARLALLAVHAARRSRFGLDAALAACYADRVPEVKMAEAISLVMWPCGVNCFMDAADAWLALLRTGRVDASPPFRAWAETPGQDGFHLAPRD